MPTYEYKCLACGHNFEMYQKMNDEPIKECPKCKGKVKRLIGTGSGPIFKGSGFYQTDYKNAKPERKSAKPESKSVKPESKSVKPKPSDSKEK